MQGSCEIGALDLTEQQKQFCLSARRKVVKKIKKKTLEHASAFNEKKTVLLNGQSKSKVKSLLKLGKNPNSQIQAFSYDLKPRAVARKPPKSSKPQTVKGPT